MTHPEPESLLRLVGGSTDEVTRRHVASCSHCRADLATMTRARSAGATLATDPALGTLVRPPRGVWEGIQRELGEAAEPSPVLPVGESPRGARSRRTWLVVAASVAAGAVLGASVVAWAGRGGDDTGSSQQAARTSSLAPLPGHVTGGTLALTGSRPGGSLSVDLSHTDPGTGFLEVWLLDSRTGGMVSLGVVSGDRGVYAVPAGLDLTAYDQVDVSREPYDGNPAHSKVSLARGRVPVTGGAH